MVQVYLLQALRSYKLTMTVDPKYHPKIIGRKGAIITNIRTEHDVNIQFPEKNDESQVWKFKAIVERWFYLFICMKLLAK